MPWIASPKHFDSKAMEFSDTQHSNCYFIRFLTLSIFFEISVFSFNKYRYELCSCIKMEIDTCTKNCNTPVLITTCNIPLQILVAGSFSKFNRFKIQFEKEKLDSDINMMLLNDIVTLHSNYRLTVFSCILSRLEV